MSSAADRPGPTAQRTRAAAAVRAAACFCAWAVAAGAYAGTSAQPGGANAPVICHERHVEIIVGGPGAGDGRACASAGVESERSAARRPTGDLRIAPALQQARDGDRRAILQQELERAETELAQERARPDSDGRALARKREDVAALQRELQATPVATR